MQNLRQAFARYSGGRARPDDHANWVRLAERLAAHGVDANEYAYWLIFIDPPPENMPVMYDGSVLIKRNYVCSEGTFQRFLGWRAEHDVKAQITVDSQYGNIKSRVAIGNPLHEVLLDLNEPLGAMTRCEVALRWLNTPETQVAKGQILKQFQELGSFILAGCPVYRRLCPVFAAYLQERHLL